MATRTTYTATITVPVYVSWRCEACENTNIAVGTIACKRQAITSSWRSSKQKEAEERAANSVREEWVGEAYKIISDPNHCGRAMYSNFFLQRKKCSKCGKKPRWNKNFHALPLALSMPVALFSIIAALMEPDSVAAWLIFLISAGVIVWEFIRETAHERTVLRLPKKYTPVIGSTNPELIEYAKTLGKTIPDPFECMKIVNECDVIVKDKTEIVVEKTAQFCRKCGEKLIDDSQFCHKCGTEIIKDQKKGLFDESDKTANDQCSTSEGKEGEAIQDDENLVAEDDVETEDTICFCKICGNMLSGAEEFCPACVGSLFTPVVNLNCAELSEGFVDEYGWTDEIATLKSDEIYRRCRNKEQWNSDYIALCCKELKKRLQNGK